MRLFATRALWVETIDARPNTRVIPMGIDFLERDTFLASKLHCGNAAIENDGATTQDPR